jgi:hypothetical protein
VVELADAGSATGSYAIVASSYVIVESATTATAVRPPKIGSNLSITSRASLFLSIDVMISFPHMVVKLKRMKFMIRFTSIVAL